MTDLIHVIQFLQTAITILLGLALGEAFKQLVPDNDENIDSDRIPLLLAFLFMIIPFFHGISRHFFITYLTHAELKLETVAGRVALDGMAFMTLGALFFVMCRSLSSSHWMRFHVSLFALLIVDTVWIVISILEYGEPLRPWLILNALLMAGLCIHLWIFDTGKKLSKPGKLLAGYTGVTTALSYVFMKDFYLGNTSDGGSGGVSDLTHFVQFLQTAVTVLLALALGEAFKQLVPDGNKGIRSDRVYSLVAFLFMIVPFFHGISRDVYTVYLTHPAVKLADVAGRASFDGACFMTLAAFFFVMSRSLSPIHWRRFHLSLLTLLGVDTVWIVVSMSYKAPFLPWLILNIILIGLLCANLRTGWYKIDPTIVATTDTTTNTTILTMIDPEPIAPAWLCAFYTANTTLLSYVFMGVFYL